MAQVTDPVCGMKVDTETAKYKSEHMGQAFYFCSPGCKKTFDKEPMKYMGQSQGAEETGDHSGHSH